MANSVSGFWQTLVAAANEAQQLLHPNWELINSVYMDTDSQAATIGQTIDVVIPGDPSNNVTDAGVGDIVLSDISFGTTPIAFSHHPLFGYTVRDFEQFNSPQQIRQRFLDAALIGVKNYINNDLASLFNTTNFATNTAISCTSHIITTTQALTGYGVLSDQFVPVRDNPNDMSLIVQSQPYTAILGDSNWTQAQIAGMKTAEQVRATGVMPVAYGFSVKLDQQLPTTGAVGSRTYTAALFHRWAVAMVTRPIATPDTNVVESMMMDFAGVPVRVMLGYNQYPKLGWVVTIDAGYGRAVVRPSMCQLYTIAE